MMEEFSSVEAAPSWPSLLDLSNPDLDWVKIAEGMGVAASRAEDQDAFNMQFADAMKQKGPRLIEAVI